MTGSFASSGACHSAIYPRQGGVQSRACGLLGTDFFRHIIQAYRETRTSTQSAATTLLPVGNGRLLTTRIERTRTQRALLVVSAFLPARRDILPGILNFCRTILAAGKPSFFSFVNGSAKPTNGIANTLSLSPVVLSLSVLHVRNMQHRNVQDHGKNHRNHG